MALDKTPHKHVTKIFPKKNVQHKTPSQDNKITFGASHQ